MHALLFDSGETSATGLLRRLGVAFRYREDVGSREYRFEAQSHGLHARCLRFAAWVAPGLAQDSLPAGGHPWLAGTFTRWIPLEGFGASAHHVLLRQTSWRTTTTLRWGPESGGIHKRSAT